MIKLIPGKLYKIQSGELFYNLCDKSFYSSEKDEIVMFVKHIMDCHNNHSFLHMYVFLHDGKIEYNPFKFNFRYIENSISKQIFGN